MAENSSIALIKLNMINLNGILSNQMSRLLFIIDIFGASPCMKRAFATTWLSMRQATAIHYSSFYN